jgi:riboflavin kinase/FMN adenylyltransferase
MSILIRGKVIEGKKKGKTLGFPTANVVLTAPIESGVYAGSVIVEGQEFKAGIFVSPDGELLEAYIIDFSGDLYGKEIEVRISKKIRDVRKFENNEELKEQIKKDISIICLLG